MNHFNATHAHRTSEDRDSINLQLPIHSSQEKPNLSVRTFIILLPLMAIMILLGVRMISIHVDQHEKWSNAGSYQRHASERSPGKRGPIKDITGKTLAYSASTMIVTADPTLLKDPKQASSSLATLLKKDPVALAKRMTQKNKRLVYLKRNVSHETAQKIKALNIKGIGFEAAYQRVYPLKQVGCFSVGWAGIDGGLSGVEYKLESLLRGIPGFRRFERDASRRAISRSTLHSPSSVAQPPQTGLSVTLTLHAGIQHAAEVELQKILEKYKPKAATCVVMDLQTGAILAMAGAPSFDLNKTSKVPLSIRRNRALSDCYEPGSTFKTFIAAMALEKGACKRSDRFFCENGSWRRGYRTLHDAHAYGWLTFDEVIIKSSNIGAAKEGLLLGRKGVYDAVTAFGFGARTKIDLPGEGTGIVRAFRKWTKDSLLSVPMGQEIATTPLQLVTAYSAMLNGGVLLRPQLVSSINGPHGEVLYAMRPQPVRRVIGTDVSRAMREMLHATVIRGTARRAWCEEYAIGGKTGTAQKVVDGRYSHDKYVGSFCGFAPVENPRLVCLVAVDEPVKSIGYYGGTVAAPAVREILRRGLHTLGIPPRSSQAQAMAKRVFDRRGG